MKQKKITYLLILHLVAKTDFHQRQKQLVIRRKLSKSPGFLKKIVSAYCRETLDLSNTTLTTMGSRILCRAVNDVSEGKIE